VARKTQPTHICGPLYASKAFGYLLIQKQHYMKIIIIISILYFSITSLFCQEETKVDYLTFLNRSSHLIDTLKELSILHEYTYNYYGFDSLTLYLNNFEHRLTLNRVNDKSYSINTDYISDIRIINEDLYGLIDELLLSDKNINSKEEKYFRIIDYIKSLNDSTEYFTLINYSKSRKYIPFANNRAIGTPDGYISILNLNYLDILDSLGFSGPLYIAEIDEKSLDKVSTKKYKIDDTMYTCYVTEFDDSYIAGLFIHEIFFFLKGKVIIIFLDATQNSIDENRAKLYYKQSKIIIKKLEPFLN